MPVNPPAVLRHLDYSGRAMDDDDTKRLVCVSGGNVWLQNRSEYPAKNELTSLEDPAQSWNVLTVGACTAMEVVTDHNGDIVPDAVSTAIEQVTTRDTLPTSGQTKRFLRVRLVK